MIAPLLHRFAARPRIYDFIQFVAGAPRVRRHVAAQLALMPPAGLIVDIGGGTGLARPLFGAAARYLCLDIDPAKVRGYLAKHPGAPALIADAAAVPLADASVDLVLCTLVSHHLDDPLLHRFIDESARILRPTGKLLFVDCVWKPLRLQSRLIWRYDRGSHPRPASALRDAVSRRFTIDRWEQFAVFHEYVLCVATAAAGNAGPRTARLA